MALIISDKYKYIFFHLPKNAGTTVANNLLGNEDYAFLKKLFIYTLKFFKNKNVAYNFYFSTINIPDKNFYQIGLKLFNSHSSVSKIQSILEPEIFNSYYKFAVIRNPFDRFVSRFLYYKKIDKRMKHFEFKDFLEWDIKADRIVNKQHQFLLNLNNEIGVNKIIKFENLQDDFKSLSNLIGIKKNNLKHLNFTENTNYKKFYDEYTKEKVLRYSQKDLSYFDYTF
tara:strand:+ start:32 stop:709 length:678 start_codon:yes stop_codon:yes gene_type:complete